MWIFAVSILNGTPLALGLLLIKVTLAYKLLQLLISSSVLPAKSSHEVVKAVTQRFQRKQMHELTSNSAPAHPCQVSRMLPKLKHNHCYMMNMCTVVFKQRSSRRSRHPHFCWQPAGEVRWEDYNRQLAAKVTLHNPSTQPPRRRGEKTDKLRSRDGSRVWEVSTKEPEPKHRFVLNLIERFNKKQSSKGRKEKQKKTPGQVSEQSRLIRDTFSLQQQQHCLHVPSRSLSEGHL